MQVILETERLFLRKMTMEDFMFQYRRFLPTGNDVETVVQLVNIGDFAVEST